VREIILGRRATTRIKPANYYIGASEQKVGAALSDMNAERLRQREYIRLIDRYTISDNLVRRS
jgi:hypothetical protein